MAHGASNMSQMNNVLILEDSEHSFIVLGKDLIKSIRRGSSPDEGVSDCDESDEQSIFSSVSNCDCNAADNTMHETLKEQNINKVDNNIVMKEHEYERKMAMFQNEVALTLRETSENCDLLRSVEGSIDEIDRAIDYMEQSVHSTIASPSIARTRNFSLDSDDVTLASLKSAKMAQIPETETQDIISMETTSVSASVESWIQDAMSDVTEVQSMGESEPRTEFSADSRKLEGQLQKTNTSDIDPRDLEIMHLKLTNKALKERIERLENKDFDQSTEPSLPSVNFIENLNLYKETLQKLREIKSMKFMRGMQLEIVEDKQNMIDAEQQFRKILSDYSSLDRNLASITQEKSILKDETADLSQQLESLRNKKDLLGEIIAELKTLKKKINDDVDETNCMIEPMKTFKGKVDSQEQSHKIEKQNLLLRENVTELTKELEAIKVENDALIIEKNKWSEERECRDELNKLLRHALKISTEKCDLLNKKNTVTDNICGKYKENLDDLKAELADARMMISELQAQNSDLQESENVVDVYISRNEKQEMDIFRLRAIVKSNLSQIESLTEENKILHEYISRKLLKQ